MPSYRLMVRTLDFHSKNVGSNPASLNIFRGSYHLNKKLKSKSAGSIAPKHKIRYTLNFRSLISPFSLSGASPSTYLSGRPVAKHSNKLHVKQSYLMLTWFLYLKQAWGRSTKRVSFFVKPVKQSKYTTLKAPMAHKTFSQEQYMFRSYSLSVSFIVSSTSPDSRAEGVNGSLYLAHIIRNSFLFFETNLFLLQRIRINFPARDKAFFRVF